ncbi:MAG: aminoacyl-tRNA hydrolase [Ruminococcus sp.]|jgi:PTH1 family peptidyl-tRNA hydrolase|nr:aminoacyl-tRNA hydrolase [Ruminococcus sp.]
MGIMELFNQISSGTKTGPVEYIITGLGNPGIQYQDTRHNAGFMVIDTIAAKYGADVKKIKFKSLCGECTIGGKKCLLMKPSTYMNNSGEAVVEALNFYKLGIENLIVIYDDISLEPSKLRIRRKGSDGGHNGIKSIIYLTGEDTFPRVKIGVGKKPHPQYNLADWVLSSFKADEVPLIKEAADHAAEAVELMVSGKINDAMNKFN